MRIAIIANGFPEASVALAKHLAMAGIEVDYYKESGILATGKDQALEYDKVSRWFLFYKKVNYQDVPELAEYYNGLPVTFYLIRRSSLYHYVPFLYKLAFKKIIRMIKKEHYDVINLIGGLAMKEFHDALKDETIYHSVHEVGSHSKNVASSLEIDSIIQDRTPVHFFSESTRNRFLKLKGADKCKSVVIPFGKFETMLLYDKEPLDIKDLDISKPTFLFFGYLSPYKGLDVLVEAMKLLKDKADRFNLIVGGRGKDPSLDYFRKQKNCMVINKVLSNSEINTLNKIATAVIMPYKSASQTGIAPVAFMYGNPVIAARVGALPEVVCDGENGLLVAPGNPKELAEAMLLLVENKELVNKLSEGAKKYGHGDCFDWDSIVKQTVLFFTELVEEKKCRTI